eukprot:5610383-Amphidinium_carterae.1
MEQSSEGCDGIDREDAVHRCVVERSDGSTSSKNSHQRKLAISARPTSASLPGCALTPEERESRYRVVSGANDPRLEEERFRSGIT